MANSKSLKSEFILLCDYAFIGDGGKLCVIGKFETIFVQNLPSAHPELFIVAHFSGEPNAIHEVRLQITDPVGNEMIGKDAPSFKIQLSGYGTGNLMHRLFHFPINASGSYMVSFKEGEKKLATTTFLVIHTKSPKTQLN